MIWIKAKRETKGKLKRDIQAAKKTKNSPSKLEVKVYEWA
jgi:hypothetical protein